MKARKGDCPVFGGVFGGLKGRRMIAQGNALGLNGEKNTRNLRTSSRPAEGRPGGGSQVAGDGSRIASPGCRSAIGVALPWAIVRRPFRPHRVHVCEPFPFGCDDCHNPSTNLVRRQDGSCIASLGCRSAFGVALPWAIVQRPFRPHRVHVCEPFPFGWDDCCTASIAPTPVRKVHCNPSTALTFRGKLIATRRQRLLFEESRLQAVDGAYFSGEDGMPPVDRPSSLIITH